MDNPPSNVTVTNDNPESDNNMEQDIEDDSPEDQGTICTISLCKITCTYCRQFSNTPSRVSTPGPILRGEGHCLHCFCMPCITELPPDFLRGSASPHPANNEKRYRLYRLYWQCLNDLNVWSDDEYLAKKERRTDRREIFPECIIHVGSNKNHL